MMMNWTPVWEKGLGVAIFPFKGQELFPSYGITLDLGDTVVIIEECGDWYFGYSKSRRDKKGIFPCSHIRIRCRKNGAGGAGAGDLILAKTEDPIIKEAASTAREWGEILKRLFVSGGKSTYAFDALARSIRELVDGRKQLITGTFTLDQLKELKSKLTVKIDWKNKELGLDLVPRVGWGEVVNPDEVGAVELYHVHKRSSENAEIGPGPGRLSTIGRVKKNRISNTIPPPLHPVIQYPQKAAISNHLYCEVRGFSFHLNDDCEVYFSLFDAQRGQFITERFSIRFNAGNSSFVDKLQNQGMTIFEDLGSSDLHADLYLVAQIVRFGKMSYSESSVKKSNQCYKRPFATGILPIGEIVFPQSRGRGSSSCISENISDIIDTPLPPLPLTLDSDEKEFTFKFYTTDEKDFSILHELLIKKQMSKVSVVSGSAQYGAIVALKLFHGRIQSVRLENLLLVKGAISTKKLGFPDVIMPGDVRNDLYVTLDHGEFEKGGKATGKNIEVSIVVLDEEGRLLPGVVYGSVGQNQGVRTTGADEYQSVILYHHNSPRWNETIRLTVPIEKFSSAHVRVEFYHCSTKDKNTKKLFGFSFMSLLDKEETTVKDGSHELCVYKCEDRNKLNDPRAYMGLPSFSNLNSGQTERILGNHCFQRSLKETFFLSTLLVSTKLTQNVDLVAVLKWKQNKGRIKEVLNSMPLVGGEEIVKFLIDVLDVLFQMFLSETGDSSEYSGDVFIALVDILVLLEDGKFEHFKPVLDAYITTHFAAALVFRGLLGTVQHYAEVVTRATKEFYPQLQKCFESVEFIFKFIVQSYILFTQATGDEMTENFSKHVSSLFTSLNKMLNDAGGAGGKQVNQNQADYVPIQAALLCNLSKIYKELSRIMPTVELTVLVVGIFKNIPLKESAHPLSSAKLTALHHLVTSQLFTEKECRGLILPEICRHLRHHLSCREELKLCTAVLDDILIFLHSQWKHMDNRVHDDIETVATSTLEMLVQSVLVLERTSPIVGNLVTNLIGLLQLMGQFHYNRLWDEFRERKPLRDLLLRVFLVFRDLIKHDVFPVDWMVMKLLTDSIMLKSLHEFSQPLVLYFLTKHSFDSHLWSHYFNLAVAFLTQPALQLEKFGPRKRELILQRYGDMRVQMGFQILSMWSNLGENKIHFIPSMVGPFLEVTLVPEIELRKATLNIFYDMLEAEQNNHGDFKQVESELIDKLDMLVSQNKGDDEYRQLFNSMENLHKILLDQLEDSSPPWKSSGIAFINSVTRLLERLLDYRNVLQGDENRDKRMSCTVNLLDFYKTEINRQEMYLRYIYKLHDLHLSAESYTEAGFTLLLHSEMLKWTHDQLPAEPPIYPAQSELERKEEIYLRTLKYFDQGKMWEKGIPLCKELANLYEFKTFDYTKLSQILQTQANFYENILSQLRPEPEYFRVGYFGKGFPLFVRNKEFIYRGLEYERLTTFIQRILTEWPTAQVLKPGPPDESIFNSDEQFLQICSIKPLPDTNNPILKSSQVPEKIQAYYNVNNVDAFLFDRRLPNKSTLIRDDPDNEFKNMWIERTIMRTANPLPGILRWFEIIEKKIEEITPVRYAVEKMEDVNRQLKVLINQYINPSGIGEQAQRNVNPLSMRLQGILDANVMGGIPKYRDAFFTDEFLQNHPDSIGYVTKLRGLILEQVNILDQGLLIHGKLASAQVQPLHNRLLECFAILKSNVESDFSRSPTLLKNVGLRRSDSGGLRDSGLTSSSTSSRERDSFRKGGHNNSIINTPLPPVPVPNELIKRITTSSSNRSSNSSGYGHFVGNLFEPNIPNGGNNSDEDDVYSKPTNDREYCDVHIQATSTNIPTPPPIPNRSKPTASLVRTNSSSLESTSEYIIMPPNRVRELQQSNQAEKLNGNSQSVHDSSFSSTDSFHTPVSNGNNHNDDISVTDGPPLPPRASTIDPPLPPLLPKRQPKKTNLTTPMSSISSTGSEFLALVSGTGSGSVPSSPTKQGPPVPPKPLKSTTNSNSNSLKDLSSSAETELYLNKQDLNTISTRIRTESESPLPPNEQNYDELRTDIDKTDNLNSPNNNSSNPIGLSAGIGTSNTNSMTRPGSRARISHKEYFEPLNRRSPMKDSSLDNK